MNRKPYCPWSGCGRPNGAAPPCPVICRHRTCGYGTYDKPYTLTNRDKVCPKCKYCLSCFRLSKKEYDIKISRNEEVSDGEANSH